MGTVGVGDAHQPVSSWNADWVSPTRGLRRFEKVVLGAVGDSFPIKAQLIFSQVIESAAGQVSSPVGIIHLKK